jgi:hypothetical protein
MKKRILTLFAPALLALVCAPLQAATTTLLTLSDGLGDTVSIDQSGGVIGTGTFNDMSSAGSGAHNTITFVGSVGSFNFIVTTGRGGGVEVLPSLMNLNSIDAIATGAGTLTTTFTDSDYTDLAPMLNLSASNTFTASTPNGSTANFAAYGSPVNAIPATTLIGNLATFTDVSFPSGQSNAVNKDFANPIGASGSLSEVVTLAFTGGGEIDSGFTIANVASVPEPASIIFLSTIGLGLTGLLRKKQVKRS